MSAAHLATLARTSEPQTMLRRFLALDATVTGANGIAYAAASGPLGRLLGIDPGLLLGLGLFLLAYAAGVAWLATRRQPPVLPVRAVIEANLAWAGLSFVALAMWLSPSTAGAVWVPVQALTVAGFAGLQYMALRAASDRG
ncbi:hypothetical protein [Streptomyces sporangiiformans]|uniref:Integral membrane protein n=1 Tax=Streptomyces sporangiiformans TaxID=2315329 RepID=A0A505D3R3_9ACTN|nr:hypothetical protein [Streptomyces sporangiiformans]TPQ16275.1 hypothetical protein FGD71_042495 [Streptomyces sporangiiformans]